MLRSLRNERFLMFLSLCFEKIGGAFNFSLGAEALYICERLFRRRPNRRRLGIFVKHFLETNKTSIFEACHDVSTRSERVIAGETFPVDSNGKNGPASRTNSDVHSTLQQTINRKTKSKWRITP
jgi:hypothetical protein